MPNKTKSALATAASPSSKARFSNTCSELERLAEPSAIIWLTGFIEAFERPGRTFSKIHEEKNQADGTIIVPWIENSPDVSEFVSGLYEKKPNIVFDWAAGNGARSCSPILP